MKQQKTKNKFWTHQKHRIKQQKKRHTFRRHQKAYYWMWKIVMSCNCKWKFWNIIQMSVAVKLHITFIWGSESEILGMKCLSWSSVAGVTDPVRTTGVLPCVYRGRGEIGWWSCWSSLLSLHFHLQILHTSLFVLGVGAGAGGGGKGRGGSSDIVW